jgi:hypothetical protein
LNLDQLATVDEDLSIGTTNDTSDHGWMSYVDLTGKNPNGTPAKSYPIDIKLPSLVNATYIELWGNISRYADYLHSLSGGLIST